MANNEITTFDFFGDELEIVDAKARNDISTLKNNSGGNVSIDDTSVATNKTWSSSKINTQLKDIANELGKNEDGSDIELPTTDKTIKGAITELFQNVSNGKTLIASAITDRGIDAENTETFTTLSNKIRLFAYVELCKVANITSHCSNIGASTVKINHSYSSKLVVDDGYKIDTVTIIMNNVDVTNSVLDASYNINIPIVLGDIHITITTSPTYYKITRIINNGSFNNTAEIVNVNASYTTNVFIEEGYTILSVRIMMGENDITSTAWSETNKVITIENVTGEITIIISTVGNNQKPIQNGLVVDIQYVNGKVVNAVTGEEYTDITYDEVTKCFNISTSKVFSEFSATEYTAELTQYYKENDLKHQAICLNVNGWNYGFTDFDTNFSPILNFYYQTPQPSRILLPVCLDYIDENGLKLNENYKNNPIVKLNENVYFSFSEDGSAFNNYINGTSNIGKNNSPRTFEKIKISLKTSKFTHFRLYNRKLDITEQKYNYSLYGGWKPDLELSKQRWGNVLDGIKDIGSPLFYTKSIDGKMVNKKSNINVGTYTENIDNKEKRYNIRDDYALPINLALPVDKFTSIYFLNPVNELRVGQKYSILATPYPYDVGDKFVIKYTSNNDAICGCTQGVLFPKKTGSVVITATILGTNITNTCCINIVENPVYDKVYTVPKDYKDENNNPLMGGTSEQTTNAIFNAITYAHNNNYNKIIFPTNEYKIKPINITTDNRVCYKMPNNICVDFNNSTIFIEDNDYCKTEFGGYQMILFDDEIKDSIIINATIYGERYNSNLPNDKYHNYTEFAKFKNAQYCGFENCTFNSIAGFGLIFESNNFSDYYVDEGTTEEQKKQGLAYGRGRIRCEDLIKGQLNDNGEIIDGSNNDTVETSQQWISTKLLFFGHNETTAKRIKLGFMGDHWYTYFGQRWYNVYWYDENKALIRVDKYQYQFEDYDYPYNAKYFKISIRSPWSGIPTTNGGEDSCVLHFYPMKDPKYCYFRKCKVFNPDAYAITFVGGYSCLIEDCYLAGGTQYNWSIDMEDGYLNQRHNIIANSMLMGGFSGSTVSSNTVFIGSYICPIRISPDTEQSVLIGNIISSIYGNMFGDKQCMIFTNNYTNITVPTTGYSGIIVENNNKTYVGKTL